MDKVAKFEKVSCEQYLEDSFDILSSLVDADDHEDIFSMIYRIYDSIQLPKRATYGSAGYDFFMPFGLVLGKNESVVIPTGIRCRIDDGWVLKIYPRSGHGFKYGVHLANTVGIIDSDYYQSANEGHIMVKLMNDSSLSKQDGLTLKKGMAYCQGVFLPYGITVDDKADKERDGGFGSTDAQ